CGFEGHLVRACPGNVEHEIIQNNSDGAGQIENKVSDNQQEKDRDTAENKGSDDGKITEQGDNHEEIVNSGEELGQEKTEVNNAVVGSVVEAEVSRDIDMTDDDSLFKTPTLKRKTSGKRRGKKARKEQFQEKQIKERMDHGVISDHSNSDNSLTESESESVRSVDSLSLRISGRNAYTLEKIKSFLQNTKGMKGVQVEDFFPDRDLFIESARVAMKEKGMG
ncbi:hypothetical protein M9458_051288, partial [Cirrhinus mrigala]